MGSERIYIVMPAYNEEANIEDVIKQWHPICEKINAEGHAAQLVIANDGSKDNTYTIMEELRTKYPLLLPINKPNSGHGATVMYLYKYALDNGADYIFQTDSDGQTLPEEFWPMWENRDRFDFHTCYRDDR